MRKTSRVSGRLVDVELSAFMTNVVFLVDLLLMLAGLRLVRWMDA